MTAQGATPLRSSAAAKRQDKTVSSCWLYLYTCAERFLSKQSGGYVLDGSHACLFVAEVLSHAIAAVPRLSVYLCRVFHSPMVLRRICSRQGLCCLQYCMQIMSSTNCGICSLGLADTESVIGIHHSTTSAGWTVRLGKGSCGR